MIEFSEKLQLIRPSIPIEELSYRNQYHRNWGILNPVKFKEGVPIFIFPPYKNLCYMIGILILIILFALRYNPQFVFVYIIMSLMSFGLLLWACNSGHGIASTGLPLLNEDSLRHYRGFCQPCRIFTGQFGLKIAQQSFKENIIKEEIQEVTHCKSCRVCYYQRYFHSSIIGICITKRNYFKFFALNIVMFVMLTKLSVNSILNIKLS